MPECRVCDRFDADSELCTVVGASPIRKCVIALLEQECPTYRGKVLEIGCGGWDFAKRLCESAGSEWFGIDAVLVDMAGRPTIATKQGTVDNIPYSDDYFDVVLGVQTLEHLEEFGSDFFDGLEEIHRVLKPGGLLSLNFPIHFHGHPMFVRGDVDSIRSLFLKSRWRIERLEPWRKDPAPLPEFRGWRGNEYVDAAVGSGRTSWIAQLHAVKLPGPRKLLPHDREIVQRVREHLRTLKAPRTTYGYSDRLLPDTPKWTSNSASHFARYSFTVPDVVGKRVLDIGCGVGYGSKLLAEQGAASVVGIDYADQAIKIARHRFSHDRVEYRVDDADRLENVEGTFDVIIAFDVLERMHEPERMFRRCLRLMNPGALFFCSTPNANLSPKREDGTPENPYHVREYGIDEFLKILNRWFPRVDVFGQDLTYDYRRFRQVLSRIREESRLRDRQLWSNPVVRLGRVIQRFLHDPVQWSEDPNDVLPPERTDFVFSRDNVEERSTFVARATAFLLVAMWLPDNFLELALNLLQVSDF
jgi:2-polyprenyl-3-methyl-5-hydroxy-6-metoxy-1,4-benzoquinol methylase